jgi:HPt (histidine-containing phosphotransfer) domain-containing protein
MDDRLKALYSRYRDALPERLGRLDGLLAEARGGSADSLKAFVADLHKLAGTAGSFGFDELGTAAGSLENAIRDQGLAGAGSAIELWQRVSQPYRQPAAQG